MYLQCKVEYKDGSNSILWMEEKFAKKGKVLMDEDVDMKCQVSEVYRDNPKSDAEYRKLERMFKSFKDHDGEYK